MTDTTGTEAMQAEIPVQALVPSGTSDVRIPAHLSLTSGDRAYDVTLEFKLASDEVVAVVLQSEAGPAAASRDVATSQAKVPKDAGQAFGEVVLRHLRNVAMHERTLGMLADRLSLDPDSVLVLLTELIDAGRPGLEGRNALTEQDENVLASAGVNLESPPEGTPDPVLTTAARHARFVADSLSVREAADLLGVSESRVRQRLTERSLYGVRAARREWKLARWQFSGDGSLPGLADVLRSLPSTLHPLAVDVFVTTPNPDLQVDGEELSPIDWLVTGGNPGVVAELIEDLPYAA